jgi:hypothetical protein
VTLHLFHFIKASHQGEAENPAQVYQAELLITQNQ